MPDYHNEEKRSHSLPQDPMDKRTGAYEDWWMVAPGCDE
jgi:hypothetical protein